MLAVPFELPGFVISRIYTLNDKMVVFAHAVAPNAMCPACNKSSYQVHSYYFRQPQDLPISDKQVEMRLTVRRFRCTNPSCPKKTFAERLEIIAPYAQRSERLNHSLRILAMNLSAQLTSKLLKNLHLGRVSSDTLLRLTKQIIPSKSATPAPKVIGVDDFAFRRGQRYGTIIVDLVEHRPIDLLADRTAKSFISWLKLHPEVEIVSRDRSTEYTYAISQGAPKAVQVADRWHIIKNWKEVLERIFQRNYTALMQRLKESGLLITTRRNQKTSANQRVAAKAARDRRTARYDAVKRLEEQGYNILQIAQQLQMSRMTVRKYQSLKDPPAPIEKRRVRQIIDPYLTHLQKRWLEGCHNAKELWRELVEMGFTGSYKPVKSWVSLYREQPGRLLSEREKNRLKSNGELEEGEAYRKIEPLPMLPIEENQLEALPAPRNLVWLYLKRQEKLSRMEKKWISFIGEEPQLKVLEELNNEFLQMIRERNPERLEDWLEKCEQSEVVDLQTFAEGLRREYGAIQAGFSLKWSNGPVEGEVNRLKLIKRTLYGRGSFELLKQKVLGAA